MKAGHVIDIVAIAAVVVLALYDKLPAAVTASVVTMVVAGRFRPPADGAPIALPSKSTLRPPSSGTLTVLLGIAGALRQFWHVMRG